MEKIEEFTNDILEATQRASKILVKETRAFVKENHHYHSKNDYDKAHPKTLAELEAEYLTEKGYRKVVMCKECKICDFGYFEKEIGKEAVEGYYCRKYREMKLPNDFCSLGITKGN